MYLLVTQVSYFSYFTFKIIKLCLQKYSSKSFIGRKLHKKFTDVKCRTKGVKIIFALASKLGHLSARIASSSTNPFFKVKPNRNTLIHYSCRRNEDDRCSELADCADEIVLMPIDLMICE